MNQVFKDLRRAFHRHKMLAGEIRRPRFHAQAVLDRTRHSRWDVTLAFRTARRTAFDLRSVRRHFNSDRRQVKHLPFFMRGDLHGVQLRTALFTVLHPVYFGTVRLCRLGVRV